MINTRVFKQQLSELIATPSVSCTLADLDMSNRPVIDLLASWMNGLGFRCDVHTLSNQKANLIACIPGQNHDGGLVLSGHSDTVPFNENRWSSDPLALTEKDDKFFGLGSCDMKGFFPTILAAVAGLDLRNQTLKSPLYVLATADEESSMSGARALVKSSFRNARYAIIGEPTSLRPIHMHKGIGMARLKVRGQAGHSSNPELGNNAIEAMHDLMSGLLAFRHSMQERYQNNGFSVRQPTMNLGCIHGGDNPNRICALCELDFDLRTLPGMDLKTLYQEIKENLTPIAIRHGVALEIEELIDGVEPFEQKPESDIVKLAERLSGHQAKSVAFATEAPFLKNIGLQTIVMGPGSIDQAHQADEFLALDQITPAVTILKHAIIECCL